jgi:hypothetical protein
MHRLIITLHNLVTEINKFPTHGKRGSRISFHGDRWSITAHCVGSVQMTNEPVQCVRQNPIPVAYIARDVQGSGTSIRV